MAVVMPAVGSEWMDTHATIRGRVPPARLRLVVVPSGVDDDGVVRVRAMWHEWRGRQWVPVESGVVAGTGIGADVLVDDVVFVSGAEWLGRMRLLGPGWRAVRRA